MEDVIGVKSLTLSLSGRKVLEDISFSVRPGEMVGVIGPNGAGKTTLLRALLGLLRPDAGRIAVLGRPPFRLKELRQKIGYLPQQKAFERRFPLSSADVVGMGLLYPGRRRLGIGIKGRGGRRGGDKVYAALEAVGMAAQAAEPFQRLSGGQQQRVLLARALVRDPVLLLLDEPNAGLDYPAQRLFNETLRRLVRERNLTVLMVSHDLLSVAAVADTLLCINRTMHIHGRPAEVLQSPRLAEAYRCPLDLLTVAAGKGGSF